MTKPTGMINGRPLHQPTPREIRALKAVESGRSLTEAGKDLGITAAALSSILSRIYVRLGLPHVTSTVHYSHDRRRAAIRICKREGWWD